MGQGCTHLKDVEHRRGHGVQPSAKGCQECLETGSDWLHLRICLACGHVGCCDDSPKRHARGHYHQTSHAVVKSFEPGENWAWCFVDAQMSPELDAFPQEMPTRHYDAPYL